MCIQGAQTPVETAIRKLTALSNENRVKRNMNFEHAVQYMTKRLLEDDEITPESLAEARGHFDYMERSLGKKSGIVEYNKILDKLSEQLHALHPVKPVLMSGSQSGSEASENVEEVRGRPRQNRCC